MEEHRKKYKLAHGGEVEGDDIVESVMNRFTRGEDDPVADFESNDFDELDKEPAPDDADYTGASSGDMAGDKAADEDDEDTVAKVMKSRKKGDRMPRPA